MSRGWPSAGAAARPVRAAATRPTVVAIDLSRNVVPYEAAWGWMKRRVSHRTRDGAVGSVDTVLLLQHPPTYTLGTGSSRAHVKFDMEHPPAPLFRTERGGEVTYHGPGQLVMYPVIDLQSYQKDLHWYLRSLEEVAIRALWEVSGIKGDRVPGMTGVWAGGVKVCAIGVGARRWVAYHGLALNVAVDLLPFSAIVPCGIGDRPVGSVRTVLQGSGSLLSPPEWPAFAPQSKGFGYPAVYSAEADRLLDEYRYALLDAFESVFGVDLVRREDWMGDGSDSAGALWDDLTAGESDPWVQGRPAVGAIGEFEGSASAFDPHHSDDVLDPLL